MIAVNFLPQPRRLAAQRRRRTRMWSLGCAGYGLVLATAWAAGAAGHGADDTAAAELTSLQSKIEARDADLAALRIADAGVNRRLDAARSVAEHPDWSILLRLLADLRGADVALDRVAVVQRPGKVPAEGPGRGGATLTLGGVALTSRAASEFVMRMESHGLFESVVLQEVRTRPGNAEGSPALTSFSVTAALADTDTVGAKK